MFNKHNLATSYFKSSNQPLLNQRQQSSARQSRILAAKPLNLLFTELHDAPLHYSQQQKMKRDPNRQSPTLIRHTRSRLEYLTLVQPPCDVEDVIGYQLPIIYPSYRIKSPRRSIYNVTSANYSKPIHEHAIRPPPYVAKRSNPLSIPTWSPTLPDKDYVYNRILFERDQVYDKLPFDRESSPSAMTRSKTHAFICLNNRDHRLKSEMINADFRKSVTPELHSVRRLTNENLELFKKTSVQDLVDEWNENDSTTVTASEEGESLITHCNSPTLTFHRDGSHYQTLDNRLRPTVAANHEPTKSYLSNNNSEVKHTKIKNVRQHSYCIHLPPVAEYLDDEEEFDGVC